MSRKKKNKNLIYSAVATVPAVIVLVFLMLLVFSKGSLVSELVLEAGSKVSASLFYEDEKDKEKAEFSFDCKPFRMDTPGKYEVRVKTGKFAHNTTLIVKDTVDPKGNGTELLLPYGKEVVPEDFVTDIADETKVKVSFTSKVPDTGKLGTTHVTVLLTDMGGNETLVTSTLTVLPINPIVIVEAGDTCAAPEDVVIFGTNYRFNEAFSSIDYHQVGDTECGINVDGNDYSFIVSVVDSIPPYVVSKDVDSCTGVEVQPSDFVTEMYDETAVTLSLVGDTDAMNEGERDLSLVARDEGGNVTEMTVRYTVSPDTEGPVFENTEDFTSFLDEPIVYRRHLSVSDNSGQDVILEIDSSMVDSSVVGDYPVRFTATDYAGNVTVKDITVHITERTYTDEDLNFRIDGLLEKIITDGMTETEKARAIYDYLVENITYTGKSEKKNFNKAAIEGLLDLKGDCFTNSAIAVAAFKRLGMDAMIIKKVPIVTMYNHWWLIVQVDGNWYHMDTCPRNWDKPEIFLWTETHLTEYSATHTETHNYDRSLYPAVTP